MEGGTYYEFGAVIYSQKVMICDDDLHLAEFWKTMHINKVEKRER